MRGWPRDEERIRPERLRQLALAMSAGYALAVLVLAGAAFLALDLTSSVGSYLAGESLWSKAQKDAVFALDEYAANGDEEDWNRYLSALRVPLGYRQARLALRGPDPDPAAARDGFVRGGLPPEEVDGMIRLHRWLGGLDPVERAFSVWARGDSLIRELHRQAGILRRQWEPPPPDTGVVQRTMERVDSLNVLLTRAQVAFGEAMAGASRTVRRWTLWTVGGITLLLLAGGGRVVWGMYTVLQSREEALRRAERRYRRIFEDSQDAIYVTERDGTIVEVNAAAVELLGYAPEELERMDASELYHDPAERQRFVRRIREDGEVDGFEVQLETRDGEVLDCELTSTARVEDGTVVGYQGIIRDVTERKEAEEELERRALHDPLTGLPNRALLWDRLEQAVARCSRAGGPLAVLFLDLDRFKVVNDDISHAAGDRVLVKVGNRLSGCVREPDTVARVGGDEFVVLLEDMDDPDETEAVVERIEDVLEAPFRVAGHEVHLDASIGVAGLEDEDTEGARPADVADELVRRADQAMYRAKESRGTTARRYRASGEQVESRIERENALRRALGRDELEVHYQPIVDLESGTAVAVEALVRWRHPERGLLGPGRFLGLAEETGMVVDLDTRVLEEACRRVAGWNRDLRSGDPVALHTNLSAIQFEDPDLGRTLERILEETGFPARMLEVEVSEHSVMQAPAHAGTLSELGVGLCIDDFGTGYSSLAAVKEVAADTLKIDGSFVEGIGASPADEAIVRTVLTLGRSLDLQVVAEGVETDEQLRWLGEAGCRRAQGFVFARPAPAEEARAFVGGGVRLG